MVQAQHQVQSVPPGSAKKQGSGSRRIFSPTFKLQVLDSYREDSDCQGNQRATARKYGIHRRQIQKWLQMETSLRMAARQLSVEAPMPLPLNLTSKSIKKRALVPNRILEVNDKKLRSYVPEQSKEGPLLSEDEYVNVDELSDSEDETSSCASSEKLEQVVPTCLDLSRKRKLEAQPEYVAKRPSSGESPPSQVTYAHSSPLVHPVPSYELPPDQATQPALFSHHQPYSLYLCRQVPPWSCCSPYLFPQVSTHGYLSEPFKGISDERNYSLATQLQFGMQTTASKWLDHIPYRLHPHELASFSPLTFIKH